VDGQASGGGTIYLTAPDHAKVCRPQERGNLIFAFARIIDGIEHADSRQPQVLQGIGIELERAIVELGRIESNRAHPLRIDLMDLDRRIELHAEVAGLDLERNFIAMPQEMLAPLLNLLVLSEVQRAQGFGRRGG